MHTNKNLDTFYIVETEGYTEVTVSVDSRLIGSDSTGLWPNWEKIRDKNMFVNKIESIHFNFELALYASVRALWLILQQPREI